MANTRGWRVPTIDDDPNVPVWMGRLADDAAGDLDGLEDAVETVEAKLPVTYEDDAYVRAWVDAQDRAALGIRPDGSVHAPVLESEEVTAGKVNGVSYGTANSDVSGYARVWVDDQDRVAIGIRTDGQVDIPQLAGIPDLVPEPVTAVESTDGLEVVKAISGPDIVLYGDSMTAADWATTLANLTGRTVYRCGVGGETSAGIAARTNAMPYLMLPAGGAIPASGAVNVTLTSSGGGTSWPLLQGAGTPDGAMRGTLAGVAGVVTMVRPAEAVQYVHHANDQYVFTRSTAGDAVPVTRPAPFYYTNGEARRGDITVIWAGRNNFTQDNGDRVFRDVKAMANYLAALDRRFLVLAVHNGSGEGTGTVNYPLITGLNARLLAEYGRRFVDHRRYLVEYGLEDAGLVPTAQDLADQAADTVPQQLRTDTIHQTVAAREITAKQVELRLKELGWV